MEKLRGLAYWANQMLLRGHTLVCDGFDSEMMRQSMDDAEIHYTKSKRDSDAQTPSKFRYDEWIDWQESVITYLTSKKSVTRYSSISLYYVIRTKPCEIAATDKSPSDETIYNASHTGRAFETDNKEVHKILDELTIGTDASDWIENCCRRHNGRAAWITKCEHYYGPAECDKLVTVSRANIDQAFYKNEYNDSFEIYTTRLKHTFDTLWQFNQPKSDCEEAEIILKQINTNNTQLTSCIQICHHSYSANFNDAGTYLSTHISQIFPDDQKKFHARRGCGQTNIFRQNVGKAQTKNVRVYNLTSTPRISTGPWFGVASSQA